ncbi:MAG: exodeoxyribonuclease VII small subunit [Pirellulaceae bacterium]
MAKKKTKKSDTQLSFEESLAQLEETVQQLEAGQLGLSESLELYETGIKTLKECHQALSAAQRRIELLTGVDEEGNPKTESFDEGDLTLEQKRTKRSRRRSGVKASDTGKKADLADDEGDVDVSGSLF